MILILGIGESGMGCAMLAEQKGIPFFLSDGGLVKADIKQQLINSNWDFEENSHAIAKLVNPDLVIKSPGIPDSSEIIQHMLRQNIPVVSEIEWAYAYCEGKIIAITGSNGKTTTTNLIYHILFTSGIDAVKVGNIGTSFARSLATGKHEWYVLELSSFQLDGIQKLRPDISILLNITPDHLDRYEYSMELYAKSKFKICSNQTISDVFIYNADDAGIQEFSNFNTTYAGQIPLQIYLDDQEQVFSGKEYLFNLSTTVLKGKHNALNAACAYVASTRVGLSPDQIQQAMNSFVNDPHRMERVRIVDDVEYINDSKATNVDSVYYALDALKKPIIWIAGGLDKGNDYSILQSLVKTKVKALMCLGIDNAKLQAAFVDSIAIIKSTTDIQEALMWSKEIAQAGDVVLLSPACASFDLFKNYEDRGNQFKHIVHKL